MIVTAHFFVDEAEGLCGPYVSAEDALFAEDKYGKFLSGGSDSVPLEDRRSVGEAMVRGDDLREQILASCLASVMGGVLIPAANTLDMRRRCEELFRNILKRCNERAAGQMHGDSHAAIVGFGPDWGGQSLTVYVDGRGHSHVGLEDDSFEDMIRQLHDLLVLGKGLSFAEDEADQPGPQSNGG